MVDNINIMDTVKFLIDTYGQDEQRTAAWHAKRGEMLTASEIYKALANATPAQKHEIMMSKLVPRVKTEGSGPRALVWGTRFEPIAKEIYCGDSADEMDIVDTTCVPHPDVSFLGASPDGIIVTKDVTSARYGTLVEFKCPISRVFSDDTPIPDPYYHQMQLQMECTRLYKCEYVEFQFRMVTYTEWMDSKAPYKGFYAVDDEDVNVKYRDLKDSRNPAIWRREVLETTDDWTIVYWTLEKYCVKQVEHQKDWLETNLASMTAVWETVVEHRKNGTFPDHPKEKTTLTL
jgi:putative phage-type endonuclease